MNEPKKVIGEGDFVSETEIGNTEFDRELKSRRDPLVDLSPKAAHVHSRFKTVSRSVRESQETAIGTNEPKQSPEEIANFKDRLHTILWKGRR